MVRGRIGLPHLDARLHELAHRGLEVVVADDAARDPRRACARLRLVEDDDVGARAGAAGAELLREVVRGREAVDAGADDDVGRALGNRSLLPPSQRRCLSSRRTRSSFRRELPLRQVARLAPACDAATSGMNVNHVSSQRRAGACALGHEQREHAEHDGRSELPSQSRQAGVPHLTHDPPVRVRGNLRRVPAPVATSRIARSPVRDMTCIAHSRRRDGRACHAAIVPTRRASVRIRTAVAVCHAYGCSSRHRGLDRVEHPVRNGY